MQKIYSFVVIMGCLTACSKDAIKQTGLAVEIECRDSFDAIYAAVDPATMPADRGAILRCSRDRDISVEALQQRANAVGYKGAPLTSGAHVYRIVYRTERGTEPATPGYSSALVYLPDHPRAAALPVWVLSHGSRGSALGCTPSRFDPAAEYVRPDFESQVFPVVGGGFAVIAPDWAGYAGYGADGSPPTGYAMAADVGRSTLDGARALRKLIPNSLTDQVVLTGHSQGGHTTLSALAMAESYGAGGTITAAAVYTPLWLNMAAWGGLLYVAPTYPLSQSPNVNAVGFWYHYTHGEILDGPGHGLDMFKPEKRAVVKEFMDNVCWSERYPMLESHGSDALDFFSPQFAQAIGKSAAFSAPCPTDPALNATCTTWRARYAADRPHLVGAAAQVPLLLAWGDQDQSFPAGQIRCAIDRLQSDKTALTSCVEPGADHTTIVGRRAGYVNDWIAARTLGAAEPAACAADERSITTACTNPPPND